MNNEYSYVDVIIKPDYGIIDSESIFEAVFEQAYDTDIIRNMEKYYVSVENFTIPNNNIPLFHNILDSIGRQTNSITIINNERSCRKYIQLPDRVYNIQTYLNAINTAMFDACKEVGIAKPPIVILNIKLQLLQIIFDNDDNWKGNNPKYQLWMNWPTFYYFQSIMCEFTGKFEERDGIGKVYRIIVEDRYNNIKNGNIIISQETSFLHLFCDIRSIQIYADMVESTLEVPEHAKPRNHSKLFEYMIDINANYSSNFTPFVYNRIGEPVYTNIYKSGRLATMKFYMYYTTRIFDKQYKLTLLPDQVINMKLRFTKKTMP